MRGFPRSRAVLLFMAQRSPDFRTADSLRFEVSLGGEPLQSSDSGMMNHFYSLDVAIQPLPSANALFSIMVGAVGVAGSCSGWRATFLLMAHLRHACCEMRCPGSPYHAEASVKHRAIK